MYMLLYYKLFLPLMSTIMALFIVSVYAHCLCYVSPFHVLCFYYYILIAENMQNVHNNQCMRLIQAQYPIL